MCGGRGGVIERVLFASFGRAQGTCGSYVESVDSHAPASMAVVEAACVGKESCVLDASADAFGASLLETDERRWLAVEVQCSEFEASLEVDTRVPLGGESTVVFEIAGLADATISAGGKSVWAHGQYTPGAMGVLSAEQDTAMQTVSVRTSSGTYAFVLSSGSPGEHVCAMSDTDTLTVACIGKTRAISAITFASYGAVNGTCDNSTGYARRHPVCHAPSLRTLINTHCVGRTECRVQLNAMDKWLSSAVDCPSHANALVHVICV